MADDDERCVLIVDDEPDIRESMREVVEMVGCTAILASNGKEALEVLATRRPCMIILDLLMPIMTGQELLEHMRSRPELASLSVVISTSSPGRAPPGVPVIAKPIDIEKIWELMARTCKCTPPTRPS